ncbi:Fc receptor-like protein 5 [Pelodiscus sinensis]|uniref:Fc receptor-like protein 5 n=1 Tax=Pelodiscus sinensis TaxID=13735 RepID=UPI003F6B7FDC
MELPLLLPLLALLQSLPRLVSPAGLQSAPSLAPDRPYTVYLPGERVKLQCADPKEGKAPEYRLFYGKRPQGPSTVLQSGPSSVLEFTAEKGRAGTYTCAYSTQGSNQQISKNSSSVPISIAAPQLTVSPPQPVYITGEAVTLTCSAAGVPNLSGIQFYRDGEKNQSQEIPSNRNGSTASIQLSSVAMSNAGVYSCEYGRSVNGREFVSERSQNIPIAVTAPLQTPQFSVSPQQMGYVAGESITLMCSAAGAPNDSMIRFYKDGQTLLPEELCLRPHQATASVRLSAPPQTSTYTCGCWRVESGRVIKSERSRPVSIAVTGSSSKPAPSGDPPSGPVSKGPPLLLTCTAPGNTSKRRFHFYNDGLEVVNVSVTRVLRAGPNNMGNLTCGYEKNVSGKWVPSPRSQSVNISMSNPRTATDALPLSVILLPVVGGVLFLLVLLAALLWWGWKKKRVVTPAAGPEGSEPTEHTRDMDPKKKKPKARRAGAEQQDSEVAYAHIEFSTSNAQKTKSKIRARPADEAQVVYSEVASKPTHKAAK